MDSSGMIAPPPVAKPLRLHPFRGLRLDRGRIGAASAGRILARPYRAVAQRLAEWQAQGRVQQDQEPAIYLHEYTVGGITVRGLVGALDLSATRPGAPGELAVVPHEGVHPGQVEELALRMEEMRLNPAPILLVHRGPVAIRELIATRLLTPPDWRITDHSRQRHRIWSVTDEESLRLIDHALADGQALIADGHHRYAAYLRLRDAHAGGDWGRGLAMLIDHDDTPLFLGAIHRTLASVALDDLLARADAAPLLQASMLTPPHGLDALGPGTAVLTDGTRWAALTGVDQPGMTPVEVVHAQLLDALPPASGLAHHHTVPHALDSIARRGGVAVLLPSLGLDAVLGAARERLLPEKATSFQPKPSVGVIMRALDDEPAAH